MPERWLDETGWGAAEATPLAGDASARRYARLRRGDGARAILMEAPADGSTARFLAVAAHLRGVGASAPEVLAVAPSGDAALLEDLGDALFARVIAADPTREAPLYEAAVDLLAALHRRPAPPDLPAPDAATLAAMTEPAATWYLGSGKPHPQAAARIAQALVEPLADCTADRPVLVHRDFHAENLIWLPDRDGIARVGVLDFQDALAGPAAYDLVSLIEDARRDLASGLAARLCARYAAATGTSPAQLNVACAALGAQRNLRILGVFARLSLVHGKARYVDLIPRVWAHLLGDLTHPGLAALRAAILATLPPPDTAHLDRLRRLCGTIPAQ